MRWGEEVEKKLIFRLFGLASSLSDGIYVTSVLQYLLGAEWSYASCKTVVTRFGEVSDTTVERFPVSAAYFSLIFPGVTANTLKTKNPQKIAGTGLSCRQARRLASTRSSLHTSQTVYQPSSRPRRRLTSSTHAPFIDAYCRCLFSLSVHHLQCQPPCLLQLASLPLRLSQRVYDRQDSFFMLITWVTQLFTISCPYVLNIIVK